VPRVTVAEVVEQEVIDSDDYTGQTEASAIVEVRARVYGYLKTINFSDGDYVREGQTLFTIEPDEYQAIHDQSLARIGLTTANHELAKSKPARNKVLLPSRAISQEDYDESVAAERSAEAAVTAAQADANRTALDLKYTEVNAPISGRIDRALVSKGNLLTGGMTSGTLLTTIVAEQPMYVYFDVDERSLLGYMRRRAGDAEATPGSLRELSLPCYVQLADESDFPHEGKLDFASAQVNKSTGTARLRGVFENKDRSLVSGLFVRIRIPVSKPYQALLIPERALATDQNIRFVYVVDDKGEAVRRNVDLGGARGELRIIKNGLAAGERVIVKGLQRVRPGQRVEAEAESPVVAGL
jgi:RND family efflux transporter MFP subunit